MRVKMKRTGAGPDRTLIEGREYTLPDAEAAGLVDGGYAEQVAGPAQPAAEETLAEPPAGDPADQNEEERDEGADAEGGG